MRSSEYLRRRTRTQERPGGQEGSTRAERDLLEQSRVIRVRRKFSDTECARAATLRWDPRISQALAHRRKYGLAEYMAAGPALWQRWQDALDVDHPEEARVGGAIVAAALDCRRAGFAGPVPEALLRTLYPSYLTRPRPTQLSGETFAAALSWATEPVEASSALLIAADGGYETFDYLLDQLQAEHDTPGVPEATWRQLLDDIGPDDAWGIGIAAYRAGWLAFAEQAFRLGLRSADGSIIERCALGMADLANLLDDFYTADEWHKRAAHIADLPHDPAQRSALGKHLESAVEEWYLRVAGVGREPDEPGGRLIIEHEHVVNHFDGASYHQTTTRKLTNQTAEPIDRYPFRIAVDRYPGDPQRSRLQYERYPLTVAGSDVKAWHESQQGEREPMDFEVQQDLPSFKEIWLLFKNAKQAFPLMPGQSCSITYRYTVSDKHWGTWSKRKVRIPTRKLSLEFSFPTALGPTLAGSETSPSARAHPAPMTITQRQDGEKTVFIWEVEPQLNSQYRFDWQFSHDPDSEPPSASADLPGHGVHHAPNGSAHA